MRKLLLLTILLPVVFATTTHAQTDAMQRGLDAITIEAIQGQLEFLASDWTEGRGTGERGMYMASDYVASMLKIFGAQPAGDRTAVRGRQAQRSYFQNFSLTETLSTGPSSLMIRNGSHEINFDQGVDFTMSGASMSMNFNAPIVFVGYGIQDEELGIDDFRGVDVEGKIILRLTGFHGMNDPSSEMYRKIVGDGSVAEAMRDVNTMKSRAAGRLGVAGIIEVTPGVDIARNWGILKEGIDLSYNERRSMGRPQNWTRMSHFGPQMNVPTPTLTVTERVADFILRGSDVGLNEYVPAAATPNRRFRATQLSSSALVTTEVEQQRVRVRNVVGMIEGERTDEFVVVGAHLDHMGMEPGIVWNGADANASGVVGVMTIAKAFKAAGVKPKRTIIFAAWTAEEKGLIGSRYFTLYPPMGDISQYKFYLNFDMIARDAPNDTEGNMATMQFTDTYPNLERWTREHRDRFNLNLDITYRGGRAPVGGSDFASFTRAGVPIITWLAGFHPDYHRPSDTAEKTNWEKMQSIIKLGFLQMWEAANSDLE